MTPWVWATASAVDHLRSKLVLRSCCTPWGRRRLKRAWRVLGLIVLLPPLPVARIERRRPEGLRRVRSRELRRPTAVPASSLSMASSCPAVRAPVDQLARGAPPS